MGKPLTKKATAARDALRAAQKAEVIARVVDSWVAQGVLAQQHAVKQAYVDDCQQAAGSCAVKAATSFDFVSMAAADVGALAARLLALTDRLTGGPSPENVLTDKPGRRGQLGTVADQAEGVSHAARAMHAALDRIEAQLP